MKEMLVLIGVVFFAPFVQAENCPLEEYKVHEYTALKCQFYLGTTAFRNEIFEIAAAHWKYVIDSDGHEGNENLKAMALSTYAYLLYHGLGVEQDMPAAIQAWKEAVAVGDLEARKHLGFAYADDNYSGKDPVVALGWYKSVMILHPTDKKLDGSDKRVWQDAVRSIGILERKLSYSDIEKSSEYARTTIE